MTPIFQKIDTNPIDGNIRQHMKKEGNITVEMIIIEDEAVHDLVRVLDQETEIDGDVDPDQGIVSMTDVIEDREVKKVNDIEIAEETKEPKSYRLWDLFQRPKITSQRWRKSKKSQESKFQSITIPKLSTHYDMLNK